MCVTFFLSPFQTRKAPLKSPGLRIVIPVSCFSKSFVFRAWFLPWPLTLVPFLLSFTPNPVCFWFLLLVPRRRGFPRRYTHEDKQKDPKNKHGEGLLGKNERKRSGEGVYPKREQTYESDSTNVCKRNGEPKFYARKSTDEEDGTCFRQVKVKVMVRVNEGFRFVWWCVVCQNKPHTHTHKHTPPLFILHNNNNNFRSDLKSSKRTR